MHPYLIEQLVHERQRELIAGAAMRRRVGDVATAVVAPVPAAPIPLVTRAERAEACCSAPMAS